MWLPRIVRFRSTDAPELMAQAWRLRHRIFRENLGWEVPSVDLLEFDRFDRDALHCAVVSGDRLVGYWRALCTIEPYLAELSFPALLEGHPAPKSPKIWEISRFAMVPESPRRREIGRMLVHEIAAFGRDVRADRLIAVTEPAFERFVQRCGLPVQRAAGPVPAGQSHRRDVQAVLISFDINPNAASAGVAAEAA
jgi:N-acyl-L-homoserine lactone synthetase